MNLVITINAVNYSNLKNYIHVIMHSVEYAEKHHRNFPYANVLGSISYMLWTDISNIVYAQDCTKNNTSSLYELANSGTLAKILSGNLVNYLNESASILEITSMIPEVSNAQYADKINSSLHGISDSYDVEKRQIADSILKHADTFEAITFLLPNGDYVWKSPTIVNYVSVKIILHCRGLLSRSY